MISRYPFNLNKKKEIAVPPLNLKEVSVVVPVKDNQEGINQLLQSFFDTQLEAHYPLEIIIVDNASETPIYIKEEFQNRGIAVVLSVCNKKGPASARNHGWRMAKGQWIQFTDSDCLFTDSSFKAYAERANGAVGYAGNIKALQSGWISQYYISQKILLPLEVKNDKGEEIPQYLVTANCLVLKEALAFIGGFNEDIPLAGGEDVDMGLRLSQVGSLAYNLEANIIHDFEESYLDFWDRFKRYGMGNQMIEQIYQVDLTPQKVTPNHKRWYNYVLAFIHYKAFQKGYKTRIPYFH